MVAGSLVLPGKGMAEETNSPLAPPPGSRLGRTAVPFHFFREALAQLQVHFQHVD